MTVTLSRYKVYVRSGGSRFPWQFWYKCQINGKRFDFATLGAARESLKRQGATQVIEDWK